MRKLFLLTVCSLIAVSTAYADTVSGKIQNASPNTVNVIVYDNEGRPFPNAMSVKVNRRVKLSGVNAVTDLMAGDEVRLEVKQNWDGSWQAKKIEKAVMPQQIVNRNEPAGYQQSAPASGYYAGPAAPAAPNPLMDALRSPQAKNAAKGGVMGAITGGVASSASGGKAGKGALIGAGTGAAASLIGDALSQPRAPAPPTARSYYDQNGNLVSQEVQN